MPDGAPTPDAPSQSQSPPLLPLPTALSASSLPQLSSPPAPTTYAAYVEGRERYGSLSRTAPSGKVKSTTKGAAKTLFPSFGRSKSPPAPPAPTAPTPTTAEARPEPHTETTLQVAHASHPRRGRARQPSGMSATAKAFEIPFWPGKSSAQGVAARRASKSARALQELIIPAPTISRFVSMADRDRERKSTVPMREKDLDRLRRQLLDPEQADMVITYARNLSFSSFDLSAPLASQGKGASKRGSVKKIFGSAKGKDQKGIEGPLPSDEGGAGPIRAICLDVDDQHATQLIDHARREEEEALVPRRPGEVRHATPRDKPRVPLLLSLVLSPSRANDDERSEQSSQVPDATDTSENAPLVPLTTLRTRTPSTNETGLPLGLLQPPSVASFRRPLAGALPSSDTLRRGFEALLETEGKVYDFAPPSHVGLSPPEDRMSVYTYWWGFELVMPPPTLEYLGRVKEVSVSLLNLLGIMVFAVPGGTRELAPFIGVLSRYIESEWQLLVQQDRGNGIVCASTWFIPAAIVARPWDFTSTGPFVAPAPIAADPILQVLPTSFFPAQRQVSETPRSSIADGRQPSVDLGNETDANSTAGPSAGPGEQADEAASGSPEVYVRMGLRAEEERARRSEDWKRLLSGRDRRGGLLMPTSSSHPAKGNQKRVRKLSEPSRGSYTALSDRDLNDPADKKNEPKPPPNPRRRLGGHEMDFYALCVRWAMYLVHVTSTRPSASPPPTNRHRRLIASPSCISSTTTTDHTIRPLTATLFVLSLALSLALAPLFFDTDTDTNTPSPTQLGRRMFRGLFSSVTGRSAATAAMKGPKQPPAPTVPAAIKSSQEAKLGDGVEYATFASGCFWGTEHLFRQHYQHLPKFSCVSGYTGGDASNPSYRQVCSGSTGHAESVRVGYQAGSVGYGELVEFFYRTHDPTTVDRQGPDRGSQYRSAIFFHSPEQEQVARQVTQEVQDKYITPGGRKIVTQILPAGKWWDAEAYHQEYLDNNPGGYECPTHMFYW